MLPINSLDDELFEDILESAKKMIPNLTDEWLNRSAADPGVTFIELFAWLKEMQQYYLDQISTKNKYKYIKLLGEKREYDNPATAIVTISNVAKEMLLPGKCKFSADDIIFETQREENIFPINIDRFYTISEQKIVSLSEENWKEQYFIFGNEPKVENAFYICFNNGLPTNKNIDITMSIYDNYPIQRNKIVEDSFYPLGKIQYEYLSVSGWKTIEKIKDKTYGFLESGIVSFTILEEMERDPVQNGYLIRAVLKECNYEVPPILKYVSMNSVKVVQKDTLSEVIEFDVNDEEIQECILPNYLGYTGELDVFIKAEDEIFERTYQYDLIMTADSRTVVFDKSKYNEFPLEGKRNIKICCYSNEFSYKRRIGNGDGFPSVAIDLNLENVFYDDFEILVSKNIDENIWEEWTKSEDLLLEGCTSKKYFLDVENQKIIFGDGINGKIPNGEILITSCSTTFSNDGNVKKYKINNILWRNSNEKIINYEHAEGGKKALTIEQLFNKTSKNLKKVTRAVTDEDYEYIVKSTPGLMISNAKVIVPEIQDSIFQNDNPNCVYIVAEPYSKNKKQGLNKAYVKNILSNMEKYRLINTEIEVISAEYIGIDIHGEITVKPYYKDAKERIENSIKDYFEQEEWKFGQGLVYSDLYGIIDTLDCVSYIYSLSINVNGRGAKRNSNGDINIPESGLIYLKNYEIAVSDG
jgi:hypothetical protein